jgi:hypothetical protein
MKPVLFSRFRNGPPARRLTMVGVALASIAIALPAEAQQRSPASRTITSEMPGVPDFQVRKRGTGFTLFANSDLAGTGMKMTGNFGWGLSNLGPCADGFQLFECGDVNQNFKVFEINLVAATPPNEFTKLGNLYAGVRTATGGGYTEELSSALITGRLEWGPGDGTLGALFSGAKSSGDGGCRDNTSWLDGYMSIGVSLLAGSTCPETWAASGFNGPKVLTDSMYLRAFNADPNNYSFDYWQIPPSETASARTLGDFATYGEISDHTDEILQSYGSVTPAHPDRAPVWGGYPLGLDVHFDAFSFARPTLKNVVFYRMLVINNSARVYGGGGVDYDSLYFGLEEGFGGPSLNAVYFEPWDNAVKGAPIGTSGTGNCNGAIAPSGVSPCGTLGFVAGAVGWIILKSPIGDTRNKLFTTPGSPFYNPSNIHAGDTITFNHGHICGYGGCYANTHLAGDYPGFGQVASNPTATLNGFTPAQLAASAFWREFHNFDFPTRTPKFNSYVPGNWDYNHDGIQDTIFFDTCHGNPGPPSVQCVTTWADTMPGKQVNRYGNVGGVADAGPFSLKAGDTTSWVMAMFGAPDSALFERTARYAIDGYQTFYLGPEPPPVPPVTESGVRSTEEARNPYITTFFNTSVLTYTDPYLEKFARDLRGTYLDSLNPGLADAIAARATSNFNDLLVFKSCDGGKTFTADASCAPAPALDTKGSPIGVGWRAYAILKPDPATRQLTSHFSDASVMGGKTYLYSLVTRSRGFSAPIRDIVGRGDTVAAVLNAADTTISPLQREGPTVAKVYVPISSVAGFSGASATTRVVTGNATIPIGTEFGSKVVAGTYDMTFGNRFIVQTVKDTATGAVSANVAVQQVLPAARQGATALYNVVIATDNSFAGSAEVSWTGGALAQRTPAVSGSVKTYADTIRGFGFLLAAGTKPFFISTNLTPDGATPPAFVSRSDFPGFILSVNAGTGETLTNENVIAAGRDTVAAALMNSNSIQFQEAPATTTKTSGISGHYDFVFADDAFGPDVKNFALDTSKPAALVQQIRASLAARVVATTGDTSAAVTALVNALSGYAGKSLVAAKFPFAVTNTTFNRPVTLAMLKRTALGRDSTILMGSGTDTIRVAVPDDIWVPGTPYIMIEPVQRDSVVSGAVILDGTGQPVVIQSNEVTFVTTLGCNMPRLSCNPLTSGTPGATGYLPMPAQTDLAIRYATPFLSGDKVQLDVSAPTVAASLTKADLNKIRVVPNPFILRSQFDSVGGQGIGEARILFVGVPDRGTLRVYSVSGQYLQQLTWNSADLNGTGDLPYNLRTRGGAELASGLYIFVITTKDASGREHTVRGKFVVIR